MSSLTIFKESTSFPDLNTSRRVPRSGFAFTRYLNPCVGQSRARHFCKLTWCLHVVCKSRTKAVPEGECFPSDAFLDPSSTAYSRCRSPVQASGGPISAGKRTTKVTSSPSPLSRLDRHRKASYTKPPCRDMFLGIDRRLHLS